MNNSHTKAYCPKCQNLCDENDKPNDSKDFVITSEENDDLFNFDLAYFKCEKCGQVFYVSLSLDKSDLI